MKNDTSQRQAGENPKQRFGMQKVPIGLLPAPAIIYGALAMRDGARKYGPYNWRDTQVIASTYFDACMRHLLAWQNGDDLATDSGLPHLAHALACIAILIDAKETGHLDDDRPKANGLIERILEEWKTKNEDHRPSE